MEELQIIADDVWLADGPTVSFFGFPYPTRMGVVRLPSGTLWIWSPVELTPELEREISELGPVGHLVEPNSLHHLGLPSWQARWPEAKTYAPPGLAKKKPEIRFDASLSDGALDFEGVIEQVVVSGSFAMHEVLFFHRPSRTLFVGDLVQKHDPASFPRWQRWIMQADGMVGPDGSTPREWRASFLRRSEARAAIQRAIAWDPQRMVIAHGAWVREDGADALRCSLAWLKP